MTEAGTAGITRLALANVGTNGEIPFNDVDRRTIHYLHPENDTWRSVTASAHGMIGNSAVADARYFQQCFR